MTAPGGTARLTKHHGLGNDFLVALDLDGSFAGLASPEAARALCDRRRGVGADGLIVATPAGAVGAPRSDGADLVMVLHNSDGSRAEISGNGIRCLGQAAVEAGVVPGPTVVVATDAGLRRLEVKPGADARTADVRVEMGSVTLVEELAEGPGERRSLVSAGNPHLVVLDPHGAEDLEGLGALNPERNVELIAVRAPSVIDLAVWERGAGRTQACGSGSCAAAVAAHAWGLVGREVVVRNPGGEVAVLLPDRPDGVVTLVGPAVRIAHVEVPWPS